MEMINKRESCGDNGMGLFLHKTERKYDDDSAGHRTEQGHVREGLGDSLGQMFSPACLHGLCVPCVVNDIVECTEDYHADGIGKLDHSGGHSHIGRRDRHLHIRLDADGLTAGADAKQKHHQVDGHDRGGCVPGRGEQAGDGDGTAAAEECGPKTVLILGDPSAQGAGRRACAREQKSVS